VPEWLRHIPADFWHVLGEMSPYLLFGFLVAGVLAVVISPEFVERHLGGRGVWPTIKASALGVPLPLCSCSVIPVTASMRRHGAGRSATTAFLISTPQTGVDSILVTLSLLGPVFAVYRPVAALISGIIGGVAVSAAEGNGKELQTDSTGTCTDACCTGAPGQSIVYRALAYGFGSLPRDIGRSLLVGLAIAALISAAVPDGYFSEIVPPGLAQILVLMVVGIPLYVCATASIPIAAGLILAGVSPGAAFALLMTGPATNAATVTTVWKVMGRRTCLIYLGTMVLAALIGGLLLDQIITAQHVQAAMQHDWLPHWVKTVSAVVLLAVLAVGAFYRPSHTRDTDAASQAQTLTLTIKGMTCTHCADAVRRALLECPQVAGVDVDLATGVARISGRELDVKSLSDAIESLGYHVETHPEGDQEK